MSETKELSLNLNRLLKLFSGSFIIRISYTFFGFINSILLARVLGAEQYGIYIFALSIVAMLSIPTQFGIPILVIREFAIFHISKKWGLMKGLTLRSHQFVLLVSIVVCISAAIWLWENPNGYSASKQHALFISLLLLPVLSFGALRDAMLRGLHYVIIAQLPESFIRPLLLMLGLLFFVFIMKQDVTLKGVLFYYILCSLIAFLVGWILFYMLKPSVLKVTAPVYNTKKWLMAAVPIGLTGGMQVFNSQLSILYLGFIGEDNDIALFRVATLISGFLVIFMQVTNSIIMTDFASLYQEGRFNSIERLIKIFLLLILALTAPMLLIFYFYGEFGLVLFYGEEYKEAYLPLLVLAVGQFFNAILAPAFILLTVSGKQNKVAVITSISLLISLVLHYFIVPEYGILGAAIATTISLMSWGVMLWLETKRTMPVKYFF